MAKRPSETDSTNDGFKTKTQNTVQKVPKTIKTTILVTVTTEEVEIFGLNQIVKMPCETSSTWMEFFDLYAPNIIIDPAIYEVRSMKLGKIVTKMYHRLDYYLKFSKIIPDAITIKVVKLDEESLPLCLRTTSCFPTIKTTQPAYARRYIWPIHPQRQRPSSSAIPVDSENGVTCGVITRVPSNYIVPIQMDSNSDILFQMLQDAQCDSTTGETSKENSSPPEEQITLVSDNAGSQTIPNSPEATNTSSNWINTSDDCNCTFLNDSNGRPKQAASNNINHLHEIGDLANNLCESGWQAETHLLLIPTELVPNPIVNVTINTNGSVMVLDDDDNHSRITDEILEDGQQDMPPMDNPHPTVIKRLSDMMTTEEGVSTILVDENQSEKEDVNENDITENTDPANEEDPPSFD